MMHNGSLVQLNSFEAGVDMALSPSITKSFLGYQKKIRSAFVKHASKDNSPIIHTKQSVKDVHSQIWDEISPVLKDMIQPL
jgi:thymidylate kinase